MLGSNPTPNPRQTGAVLRIEAAERLFAAVNAFNPEHIEQLAGQSGPLCLEFYPTLEQCRLSAVEGNDPHPLALYENLAFDSGIATRLLMGKRVSSIAMIYSVNISKLYFPENSDPHYLLQVEMGHPDAWEDEIDGVVEQFAWVTADELLFCDRNRGELIPASPFDMKTDWCAVIEGALREGMAFGPQGWEPISKR